MLFCVNDSLRREVDLEKHQHEEYIGRSQGVLGGEEGEMNATSKSTRLGLEAL